MNDQTSDWITVFETPLPGRASLAKDRLESHGIAYQTRNEQTGSYLWLLTFPLPWARGIEERVRKSNLEEARMLLEDIKALPDLNSKIVMWFCRAILGLGLAWIVFATLRG